ncbi:MAG: cytidine deaminase [Rikenellaceae bacterium]
MDQTLTLKYTKYDSLVEMTTADQELIKEAREAAKSSYAPYSKFAVGAAARLSSGRIIHGANSESEVFPAGVCAERALLFHASCSYANDAIVDMAIVSLSTDSECYPCGLCRQSLVDAERRQGSKIRVIMAGATSATVVESAQLLLPFTFEL